MAKRKKQHLTCGCCGTYFKVWSDYIDQDQDDGFGICYSCQGLIAAKDVAEMDKAIAVFAGSLNQKNTIMWLKLPRDKQERVIHRAFEDGIMTHKIRRSHERLH